MDVVLEDVEGKGIVKPTPSQLNRIWNSIDKAKQGFIRPDQLQKLITHYLELSQYYFQSYSKEAEDQLYKDPFAGYLGMAFTTRSFLKNDVFASFEDNPDKVVNYLVKKLDFDGDGVVSKSDFIKTAPDELFNQEFYSTVEVVYKKPRFSIRDVNQVTMDHDSDLVDPVQMKALIRACPKYLFWFPWCKLFCTSEDGISLDTFRNQIRNIEELLLIILTADGHILGAFSGEEFTWDSKGHGNKDNFVFSLHREEVQVFLPGNGADSASYQSSSPTQGLTYGLEDGGRVALTISPDFKHGRTSRTDTFQNPPLQDPTEFNILCVEAWGPAISND